jgi:cytochrome c
MIRYLKLAPFAAVALLSACGQQQPSASDRPVTIEERGRAAYAACAVCHSVSDPAAPGYAGLVGPSLFAVYGAPSADHADYDYSPAMRGANLVWDEATLDAFVENPHKIVPQTRMSYAGESDPGRRAAIIAYLKTLK